jgi:hypothetical protein
VSHFSTGTYTVTFFIRPLYSNLHAAEVHIANPEVVDNLGFMPAKAYHPKLYLFDTPGSTGYVVGSANMTNSAFMANTEVVSVGKEKPKGGWNNVWDELLINTVPLTSTIFNKYRQKWKRRKKRAVILDPNPVPPKIKPGHKPVLWEAINKGSVALNSFNHFWIEAGSMSSGGSHNQLELPRGANRFFGFTHTNYGGAHITIGHPTLTLGPKSWTNRPLTWHGNNMMERINLPTLAQGGFNYQNTVILFRRHKSGFEINVLPWDDNGAIAWRAASNALKTVFRLGERGERICGLF